jgi:DNA gyrase subunit A
VVTENGFGKRTRVDEYPIKGRGTMGVLTIRYTESRGRLAGAMIVKDSYEVMFISTDGTVIRQPADGISRMGRSTQGVRLMNLRKGDKVGSIARVTEPQPPSTDVPEADELPLEPAPESTQESDGSADTATD